MKLSDIFNQLTYGELKQVTLGGHEDGAVQSSSYREIISHINLGLIDLYTRFPIQKNMLMLRTLEGRTKYPLKSAYAVATGGVTQYILDTVDDKFSEDILRIEQVTDIFGEPMPLNDPSSCKPILLLSQDTLHIPWATGDDTELMCIGYQSKPVQLVVPLAEDLLKLDTVVNLPDMFMEALLAYIEYRVQKSKGGEAGLAQANMAKSIYETLCFELAKNNVLHNNVTITNTKLNAKGWN